MVRTSAQALLDLRRHLGTACPPRGSSSRILDRVTTAIPHVLLATTGQLPSTARLAMELQDAGARVSLISPANHPARALSMIRDRLIYRAWSPRGSLEAAVRRLQPDLVIPCDERTVRDLHGVARATTDPVVKQVILRSTSATNSVQHDHVPGGVAGAGWTAGRSGAGVAAIAGCGRAGWLDERAGRAVRS